MDRFFETCITLHSYDSNQIVLVSYPEGVIHGVNCLPDTGKKTGLDQQACLFVVLFYKLYKALL